MIKQSLILIMYLLYFKKINSEETSWKDPETGVNYDWSILRKNKDAPYIIKDNETDDEEFSINIFSLYISNY